MAEKTILEEKILLTISSEYKFNHEDVLMVYDMCESIDDTIYLLSHARSLNTPIQKLIEIIKKFDK